MAKTILTVMVLIAAASLPAYAQEDRYQIVKATETMAWRLDKVTGEIVACRFDGTQMICGSTETAVGRDKGSVKEYKAEAAAERRARQEEDLAFIERLIEIFKSVVAFFIEQERRSEPQPTATDSK